MNTNVNDDLETPVVFHDCVESLPEVDEAMLTTPRNNDDGRQTDGDVFSTPTVNTPDVRSGRARSGARGVRSPQKRSTNQHTTSRITAQWDDEEMGPLVDSNNDNGAVCHPIMEEVQTNDGRRHQPRRPPRDDSITNNSDSAVDNTSGGSSVPAAIFNFTNSIVGAGCIGLGGAIAMSGGFISIALIVFFAVLTKSSLDLVIRLSLELAEKRQRQQQQYNHGDTVQPDIGNDSHSPESASSSPHSVISYEDLAEAGMGTIARLVLLVCKFSYSFGCLVAYVIVIKDNFGPALKSLIFHHDHDGDDDRGSSDGNSTSTVFVADELTTTSWTTATTSLMLDLESHTWAERIDHWFYFLLSEHALFTWTVSAALILPMCMLRDMTPLASASLVSVGSMFIIVAIVTYIYFACPDIRQSHDEDFYEKWIEIRPGVLSNLGTFIFTFVSQHTVHLVFSSLKPKLQTLSNWKIVSSCSITSAATVSLLVGVFVYMTFGKHTKSDIFLIYPHSWMIETAKLLLCVTMIFTFPFPFFTCRELIIVTLVHPFCGIDRSTNNNTASGDGASDNYDDAEANNDNSLEEPLLLGSNNNDSSMLGSSPSDAMSIASELSRRVLETAAPEKWLLPTDNRQLQLPGHIGVSFKLWLIVTGLAIASPNLGDILNLVGCASGTLIAFIFPALLSIRLEGYTNLALLILVVGGAVGTVGTYYSVKQLAIDLGL